MKINFYATIVLLFMGIISGSSQIKGDWKGEVDVQGMKLEIIFHIAEENGTLTSTMDVPAQGAAGLPVDKTEFAGNEITLSLPAFQINYKGTLDGNTINGTFYQAGLELPLMLQRFESKLPGDTSLPSSEAELKALASLDKGNYKYSVADYFAKPKASAFKLSPDGKYMSYMEKDADNKNHVYVKEIATGKVTRAVEEKDELIRGYGWINSERLYYIMDKGGDENYHIFASNVDGSNAKDLTPFDGVTASILNILKDQKDFIIISMNKNNKQIFEPFLLNVVTGELTLLYENKDVNNPINDFIFDKEGNLRGYTKLVNGVEMETYYKDLKTGNFNLIKKTNWDDAFNILAFNYRSNNKDEAYIVTNLDSDKARIVLYDLAKNQIIKEVFSHPTYDVASMSLSRKRNYEIDAFQYEGEKFVNVPVSELYKKIDAEIKKNFPDKQYYVIDKDDDETRFLLAIQSDKLYGTYYEYDVKTGKLAMLYDLMPQLKEEDMAEMRPISFTSRDGLTIYGYITLQKEALLGTKLLLIVIPHGGPQGIRESWGFNPETQLFASRGYATLQVNFRISGGYGKEFLRAGFKQIGCKLMDDVEDGVHHVI